MIGALVLLTLFIGVVTTSMEEATQQQQEEQDLQQRIKDLQAKEGLDDDTIAMYETVFVMLDLDEGGTIEEEELQLGLASIGKTASIEQVRNMMSEVDEDGSGEIDKAEFVEFMVNLTKKDAKGRSPSPSKQVADGPDSGRQSPALPTAADPGAGAVAGSANDNDNATPPVPDVKDTRPAHDSSSSRSSAAVSPAPEDAVDANGDKKEADQASGQ